MSRTRTRIAITRGGTSGRFTNGPDPGFGGSITRGTSQCTDEVLKGDGHPFIVIKKYFDGCVLNKPYVDYYSSWFNDWVVDNVRGWDPAFTQDNPVPGQPTNGEAATKAVKATNPSRPVVDIPISIAEIVEIPHLIKAAGDKVKRELTYSQKYARGNVYYHFAISPLISDLLKSFEFQRHFANRAMELKRLSKGGRGKTASVFSGSASNRWNATFQSSQSFLLREPVERVTQVRKWVFVPWIPGRLAPETDMDIRKAAIKAVLGLDADFATMWELIPWSWLIDWFSNVGDYFAGTRNIVDMSPGTCQVMTHTKTQTRLFPMKATNWSFSGGTITGEVKRRDLASPTFSAQLPFLNARQLSILGSLYVLRHRSRGPY